jgi:signal transduction histidine kinase
MEATIVTTPSLAARLQAAFADLACGQGDLAAVEEILRAIGQDGEASGAGLAEVVAGALEHARSRQRTIVGRLLRMQEEERRRLAAEIHDDAIQVISAAYMRMQLLGRKLTSPADHEACESLERTLKLAVQRLRRLTFELRPVTLDDTTLARALGDYVGQVEFDAGVTVRLVDDLSTQPSDQSRLVLYRAAQEVLTNVAKHAAASTVTVELSDDAAGFTLRIEDDGQGFSPSQSGLGLRFVRERAEAIGGSCRVDSELGSGTNVQVWVPRVSTVHEGVDQCEP